VDRGQIPCASKTGDGDFAREHSAQYRWYNCATARPIQDFGHAYATMEQPIPIMQAMQLLASGGVTMAAGAMISFSFAVSPPLTLLPPLPERFDINENVTTQGHKPSETVGAAVANTFERRWQPTDESPLTPVPRRDPLEGLVGGLLALPLAQDAPQLAQAEPLDFADAPQPSKQELVGATRATSDICSRHGLRRVDYRQNHHHYWRCARR
jgi:hypothetical protein